MGDITWKDVGDVVAPVANIVGSILSGNVVGAAVTAGKLVASAFGVEATPEAVMKAYGDDPEAKRKLLELQLTHQVELQKLLVQVTLAEIAADTAAISEVNQTMRAEVVNSEKESWYQKAWRPACGFAVALGSFAAVVGTVWAFFEALAHGKADMLAQVPNMATSVAIILGAPGAAVGIASWHRGMRQREAARV